LSLDSGSILFPQSTVLYKLSEAGKIVVEQITETPGMRPDDLEIT